MIMRCRVCGVCAGGMIVSHYEPPSTFGWPESDLCPMCVNGPDTEDETLLAILERANKETKAARDAERAGEHISAETMEMRLK